MLAAERKSKIVDMIKSQGKAEVGNLASMLSVVPETIRRDLKELEMQGILKRTYGGAVLVERKDTPSLDPIVIKRHYREKIKLSKAAAELVEDGDTIFVDCSTTLLNLIRFIDPLYNVTLLTNSIEILRLKGTIQNLVTVVCSGGILQPAYMYLSGGPANNMHADFIPSKAFISCSGISLDYGVTDDKWDNAEFKRSMIKSSQKLICVADHSKFEKTGPVKLIGIDACDVLITDKPLDKKYEEMLQSDNVIMDIVYC